MKGLFISFALSKFFRVVLPAKAPLLLSKMTITIQNNELINQLRLQLYQKRTGTKEVRELIKNKWR